MSRWPSTRTKTAGSWRDTGFGQLSVGSLLLLLFWFLDAALDSFLYGKASFSRSIFAPPSQDFADRMLVLFLAVCFILYSGRVSKLRGALERALQEALTEAEHERARLAAIVESMGEAISIQDHELTVIYQNRAHQDLMGAHLGERCYEAYGHDGGVCSDCHLAEPMANGGVHRIEICREHSQWSQCLEVTASPIKDPAGNVTAVIEVVRDITDLKLTEQCARNEASLLQHLIDTIPNPIYYEDLSGCFQWCNTAFAQWLAKPREVVIGKTIAELAPERVCQMFGEQEPGPEQETVQEYSVPRGDGELCNIICYKSMFCSGTGDRGGVVGVMIDITRRKRAEEEICDLNAALTQQAVELHQMNRELEAFGHAISHDLRSPLTRIYTAGQALSEYKRSLDENGLFFVNAIKDGCIQMEAQLEALMVLSRVTEVELVKEEVDLSRIASEKADELHLAEPDRQVAFRIDPHLQVQGDSQLLRIALENLIRNAWKYTARADQPLIELGSFTSSDGEDVFFVKDNGAGFDSQQADQLFKPFRRLHSAKDFPGTGLGLATVRRIIRRHNGRVWGEGEVGCGATFYFTVNG